MATPKPEEIDELYARLGSEARAGGYHLNPDEEFTRDLTEALLTNTKRYGYQSCPCRLADGVRDKDLDIICPCDYRDPDLAEFGACYCALYVSGEIARGEREAEQIPERRKKPSEKEVSSEGGSGREGEREKNPEGATGRLSDGEKELDYPVWRCPVCGYLCAREHPPEKCPICKADKDRFKRFM
ncbi:ferredoxin:glutaredoxin reductase [bacterium]|nr:ferredoxin:glutaredoxin reductase [bacterium]